MPTDRLRPTASFRNRKLASLLLAIAIGFATGCDRAASDPKISITVARNVADAEIFEGWSPIEYRDCPVRQDLATVQYQNPVGEEAEFWIDPTSRFEIEAPPREILLTRFEDPSDDRFVVARARFDEKTQSTLAAYRERYRNCQILVSLDDEIRWVATNDSDWSIEIPLGVFEESSMGYENLTDRDWETRWVPWPELEEATRATRESGHRALRMLACDADFRSAFEAANPGAVEMLTPRLENIECPAD